MKPTYSPFPISPKVLLNLVLILILLICSDTVSAQTRRSRKTVSPNPTATRVVDGNLAPSLERGGTIVLKVNDYDGARKRLLLAAQGQQAEFLEQRTKVSEKGHKSGWMRLKVVPSQLPTLLAEVREIGILYAENLTTLETAPESDELARRAERLQQHQARLAALLQSGRNLRGSDLLYVQERLFRAGVDESLLEQRRINLRHASAMSTVTIQMFEPLPTSRWERANIDLGNWFTTSRSAALYRWNLLIAHGATVLAYVLVFAPLWAPAVLFCAFLLWRLWHHRRMVLHIVGVLASPLLWLLRMAQAEIAQRLSLPVSASAANKGTGLDREVLNEITR